MARGILISLANDIRVDVPQEVSIDNKASFAKLGKNLHLKLQRYSQDSHFTATDFGTTHSGNASYYTASGYFSDNPQVSSATINPTTPSNHDTNDTNPAFFLSFRVIPLSRPVGPSRPSLVTIVDAGLSLIPCSGLTQILISKIRLASAIYFVLFLRVRGDVRRGQIFDPHGTPFEVEAMKEMVEVFKTGRKKNHICFSDWDSAPRAWHTDQTRWVAEEHLTEEQNLMIEDAFISN
ncbi:uncharacterized protein FFB14_09597 [Fusarium fujikuroi]|nr:uncharacterized protein FFB14_09597 [Fusarium fujikuroi]